MTGEERFTDLLVACDNALADHPDTVVLPPADDPLRPQVERELECLRRLRRWGGRLAAPPPLMTNVGPFEIVRELGRGGFGVVYLARDPRLGREVALKIPRPGSLASSDLRDRFRREARAAAGLEHPNLVAVYETGEVGPIAYIAFAYCPGPTLRDWLNDHKEPVPFTDAANLVATLADAVDYAHSHGVVHRDLTPANILLQPKSEIRSTNSETNPNTQLLRNAQTAVSNVRDSELGAVSDFGFRISDFTPKVSDFGLAKQAGSGRLTETGAVVGTPQYMAPEQADGRTREHGPAVDIYSLGSILYELLTGRAPFVGESPLETLQQVSHADPLPPRRLRPQTPRDLQTICLTCLAKSPSSRYRSAEALSADLRRFLDGRPIVARPLGRFGRAVRWARRRPAVAGLLIALAMSIVGGLVGMAALWRLAERRADDAQIQRDMARRERDDARTSLRRGVSAVDEFFTQVSEKDLAGIAGLQPVRRRLLESAVRYYQEFVDQRGDDPALRVEAAKACGRLASIHQLLGDGPNALALSSRCRDQFEALVADNPEDANLRYDLAQACVIHGAQLQEVGRSAEAVAAFQRVVEVAEALLAEKPGHPGRQDMLARGLFKLGRLHLDTRRFADARAELTRAAELWDAAMAAEPTNEVVARSRARCEQHFGVLANRERRPDEALRHFSSARDQYERLARTGHLGPYVLSDLAQTYHSIVALHAARHRWADARQAVDRGLAVIEPAARDNPAVVTIQTSLADLLHASAIVAFEGAGGDAASAVQAFERVRDIYVRLSAADPEHISFISSLGGAWNDLGNGLLAQKRHADALAAFREAVTHQRRAFARAPDTGNHRLFLVRHLLMVASVEREGGHLTPAMEALTECRNVAGRDADSLLRVARELARCTAAASSEERNQYADLAIDALRAAVSAGARDTFQPPTTNLFVEFRDRPDCENLLRDLNHR